MNAIQPRGIPQQSPTVCNSPSLEKFLTFRVDKQLFGIPALSVQDIIGPQQICKIPMAPSFVAGAINLRGRIVIAIDMHVVLGMPTSKQSHKLNVVVRSGEDLVDLLVDDVGDVLELLISDLEPNPLSWAESWRSFSAGILKLEGELTVILNFSALISHVSLAAQAG
jgi:purine-binding chemotaxis protein CheW